MVVAETVIPFAPRVARAETPAARRAVAAWLLACAALIAAMVVIGGITRLTESGLSIVTWAPVGGAVPPLGGDDWRRLFDAYLATPQGRLNAGMSLADFQSIFWWEYVHRLLGRLIGAAFLLPFLALLATGRIERRLRWPLAGIFLLGGLQGALGWFMVASGLVDQPWVSPYRLTAHLVTALVILVAILWTALGRLRAAGAIGRADARAAALRPAALAVMAVVALTIVAGGFVAGLRAGLIYNEVPFMGDGLVPPDYWLPGHGWLANAFESHAAVQFHHRVLAMASLASVLLLARALARRAADPGTRRWAGALAAMVLAQVALGVSTLLLQVPVPVAAAHQGGAVVLLSLLTVVAHRLSRGPEDPDQLDMERP